MRKNLKTLLVASTLAAGLAAAPAIYAHDSDGASGSMMGRGMMGAGRHDGQMSSMDGELQSDDAGDDGDGHEPARPNEQWRGEPAPQDDQRTGPSRG